MAAAAAHSGSEHKLQPTSSSRSAGSAGTFISSFPAGALDPPGLAPVAKVYVRPVSGKRAKKPSALDKHIRHVVLQQRANRQKAQQHAATVQHKHTQHQRFLDWGRRLRHAILRRGASSSRQHRQERPAQPMTAPAAPAAGDPQQQQQQHADDADHACADTLQSWRPVAAAAQVRELQESTRKQETLLRTSLPRVLDPSTLSTDHQTQHHQQQLLQEQGQAWKHNSRAAARAPAGLSSPSKQNSQCVGGSGTAAAEGQLHGDSGSLLDVDAFLDSLLQTASAAPATAAPAHTGASAAGPLNPSASSTLQQQQQQRDNVKSGQESSQAAALHQQRPASTCSSRKGSGRRGGSVPAWVLSEAAAAEAEEETLLEFAQGLNFQEQLQDLPDDELSAAFKALQLADAGAAEGQQDADRHWHQSFVSALNAAAMRGIADHNAAAAAIAAGAGEAGSQQGDRRSFVSSASALRHAEAAATRREQLLQKLHRLTGTQPPAAAATAAGPGMLLEGGAKAGSSVCGSTGSRLGMAAAAGAAGGSAAACDSWDSSTVVSSTAEDVGVLRSAIKHLEAGEVLAENPEMRGVHSTASVRSMLSRLDAQD